MNSHIVVLDANIAVKILHDEPDGEQATEFFKACAQNRIRIIVPEHFLYELMNVCKRLGIETEKAFDFFEALQDSILTVVTPQKSIWLLAEKIAKTGHSKSGFPSIYDSIYHALAIESEGVFVTADKRHFAKAKDFKHICLLKDWETIFQ